MSVVRWMAGIAAAVLAVSVQAAPAAAQSGPGPNDRALLVGINKYRNPQYNLAGSVADVQNMRTFLIKTAGFREDQVKLLLDGQATADNIRESIQTWLVDGSAPGARVWFHYSGHGSHIPDTDGDEEDGEDEVIVAHDVEVTEKGPKNLVLDDEIARLLAKMNDRQVTLVVDSCHSGTMTRALLPEKVEGGRLVEFDGVTPVTTRSAAIARAGEDGFVKGGNVVAWTAVAPNQVALEDNHTNPHQGVFTRRFLHGITAKAADANKDGVISHAELLDYVMAESERYCKNSRSCKGLTPTLEVSKDLLAKDVLTGRSANTTAASSQNLLAHGNDAAVTLDVLPGPRVRLGQTVTFRVNSERDGYLIVLDVNAANKLTQIFPNKFADRQGKSNKIFARRPVTIPDASYGFAFTASEPAGPGTLFAIVTEDPVSLEDVLNRHRDLNVVGDARTYLADIAERLRKPWREADGATRTVNWSFAEITYEITR